MFTEAHLYEVQFTKPGLVGGETPESERHNGEVRIIATSLIEAIDVCKELYPKYEIRSVQLTARIHGISNTAVKGPS